MIYDWKFDSLYPVSAQAAGEELERIYTERGAINPVDVVDESRPEDAVLHPCFEWRDKIAAEKWREQQARGICNCIVTRAEVKNKGSVEVRAVMHVQGAYHPTAVIIQQQDKYTELYHAALRELEAFQKKFAILSDHKGLKAIFSAIEAASR